MSKSGGREQPPPIQNRILASLPRPDYERIQANLEAVPLQFGDVLYEADDPIQYVYFPNDGMVSLLAVTQDGDIIEVGMVGYEGMAGISACFGIETAPYRMLVQLPGSAMRMKADLLVAEFNQCDILHELLLRYMHALFRQVAQSGVCNYFHTVTSRLCRWLLTTHDRARSNKMPLTHELMAQMLGTRRVSVTLTAGALQDAGLISYTRGQVTILNRKGLEAASCECYAIVKAAFDAAYS